MAGLFVTRNHRCPCGTSDFSQLMGTTAYTNPLAVFSHDGPQVHHSNNFDNYYFIGKNFLTVPS